MIRPIRAALALSVLAMCTYGQVPPAPIGSLKKIPIPAPSNLPKYVRDPGALLVLGKALFWDLQVGSDGKVACATCHFHAGADHRVQNQLSVAAGPFQANSQLTAADFPFHQVADPSNSASTVVRDSKLRAGSAGMLARTFTGVIPGVPIDSGADTAGGFFQVGGLNVRQVGDRNAPSIINAVLNFRNFWDGRASNVFSGLTPFGLSDTRANVLSNATGGLKSETLRIENASLASQAVGPVLNGSEMSYSSRSWPDVGKKMLALRPLANQRIAADDSVLGPFANVAGRGFKDSTTYLDLVKTAFQPAYWNSAQLTDNSGMVLSADTPLPAASQFSQAEFNFSTFFGLAVQAYESTLVSDDTRMDRFAEGQITALSNAEIAGLQLFNGSTGCSACHVGAEFTLASHGGVNGNNLLKSGSDTGFFHIGLRSVSDDLGLGGLDGFDKPLSTTFPLDASAPGTALGRFKTPGLRNVEFTGPYFHDGSQATLEQVVQFYNRGGDFPPNASNGPNVRRLSLSANDQASVVAFLKALSDDRVRFERAPFDHPELCIPNGHLQAVGSTSLEAEGNPVFSMSAADRWAGLPPVGQLGNTVPLQTFEELLAGIGTDGSRAHHMSDACAIEAVTATGFANVNAAAALKTTVLAQDSIVTAFGRKFAALAASASTNPPPTTLGGLTVNVQDSAGVSRKAPLFYVSPGQINYAIPEGTAPGGATISIAGNSTTFRAPVQVMPVSPGLFGNSGLAAANVITVRGGVQSSSDVVTADAAGNLSLVPIDLGSADQQVFLVLYGTGIRNHASPVVATIGAAALTASYAGAQGTYPGEDQINILLPRSLVGAGNVNVTLTVDGQTTNSVQIRIQ